jgi:tetratricopeptide (TPR) repeat protein
MTHASSPLSPALAEPSNIDQLNETAWSKRDANPSQARSLADGAKAKAEELQFERGVARSLTVSSFLHFRAGRFGEALSEALQALERLGPLQDTWLPRLYNILGISHDSLGNRPMALSFLLQQLELSKASGDKLQEATALHDLGIMAESLEKGRLYLAEALELFRTLGDRWGEALALLNLADSYLSAKDYSKALDYAKAVQSVGQHEGKTIEQAYTAQVLGDIYAAQGQLGEALAHYRQSLLHIEASSNELTLKPNVLLGLGRCYARTALPEKALSHFLEALHVSEAMDYRTMIYKCHEALADVSF